MSGTHKLLRFGVFELNLDTEELRKSGTLIKLPPQPLQLLTLLATHAGQVVTREDIKEQLWGEETYVDFEQGMNHCVKQIRTALSDNADNPLYVETLPRRGYRFLAPVVSKNVPAPAPKIIKSQSGIQSDILPALPPDGTRVAPNSRKVEPAVQVLVSKNAPATDTNPLSKSEQVPASVEVPVHSTEPVAGKQNPAPREKVTSATAAAVALAPEIARLRNSPPQARRNLAWIAVTVAFLIAGVLYWYLHRP